MFGFYWNSIGILFSYSSEIPRKWNSNGIQVEFESNSYGIPFEFYSNSIGMIIGIPLEFYWSKNLKKFSFHWNSNENPTKNVPKMIGILEFKIPIGIFLIGIWNFSHWKMEFYILIVFEKFQSNSNF